MKILLADLRKALLFFESQTGEIAIKLSIDEGRACILQGFDKGGQLVEIRLYNDGSLLPKITRADVLR